MNGNQVIGQAWMIVSLDDSVLKSDFYFLSFIVSKTLACMCVCICCVDKTILATVVREKERLNRGDLFRAVFVTAGLTFCSPISSLQLHHYPHPFLPLEDRRHTKTSVDQHNHHTTRILGPWFFLIHSLVLNACLQLYSLLLHAFFPSYKSPSF